MTRSSFARVSAWSAPYPRPNLLDRLLHARSASHLLVLGDRRIEQCVIIVVSGGAC